MGRSTKTGLEDIARAVGVSKMTVSRVLRGSSGFSEETRERVLSEVEKRGYLPNRIAAAFGAGATSTLVGVCVPRFASSLFGSTLESINATLTRLGYQTMIGSHDQMPEEEEVWLKGLASWRPAGVILVGRRHTSDTLSLLRDLTVPIVEMWDLNTQPIDVSIGFSHFDDGYRMGKYLLSRGREKFGYVGAMANRTTMGRNRCEGFEAALQDAGTALAAREILEDHPGFYAGYYGTETLLSREQKLDSIYYHDDEMAIGGMAWLASQGVRVPDDIGVAGWGGMEAASIQPRRLTTITVPTTLIGKTAAELLVGRMRGEPVRDVTVIPTHLVPGETG
ncbi:LacI family DNA-binding transcriptional regulator [Pelagibacterium halotolerans]|uniref:LacI family DNA-binding transcriptional regulator n=1 Tax=Pelagibacterium halotolerans TaxID=531813 RepID=UPI00384F98D4